MRKWDAAPIDRKYFKFPVYTPSRFTRLDLIHHAEADKNIDPDPVHRAGRTFRDELLTPAGRRQVRALAMVLVARMRATDCLQPEIRARIIAPRHPRCQATTIELARAMRHVAAAREIGSLTVSYTFPDKLESVQTGDITGLTDNEIRKKYPKFFNQYVAWKMHQTNHPPEIPREDTDYPAETSGEFVCRIGNVLRPELDMKGPDAINTVLVIGTSSLISAINALLRQTSWPDGPKEDIEYPYIDSDYGAYQSWFYEHSLPATLRRDFRDPLYSRQEMNALWPTTGPTSGRPIVDKLFSYVR